MPDCTAASMRSGGEPAGGKPSHGAALTRRNPSRVGGARRVRESLRDARRGRAIDVGVDRRADRARAAEERGGRHVQRLAGQVPQRLLDGAERGGLHQPLRRQREPVLPERSMSSGERPGTSPKSPRSSASMRAASARVVLANPNASEASPSPVRPASVRSRTISQTVRAVARTGRSSNAVTFNRGAAWSQRGASHAPAAAPQACRNVRRVGGIGPVIYHGRYGVAARQRGARDAAGVAARHPAAGGAPAGRGRRRRAQLFDDGGFAAVHRLWQTVQAMLALTFGDDAEQQRGDRGHSRHPSPRARHAARDRRAGFPPARPTRPRTRTSCCGSTSRCSSRW